MANTARAAYHPSLQLEPQAKTAPGTGHRTARLARHQAASAVRWRGADLPGADLPGADLPGSAGLPAPPAVLRRG